MPIDYKKYPENWKTEIRPRILAREGNCCKICGVKNYSIGMRDLNGNWHDEKEIEGMNSDVGFGYFGTVYKPYIKIILTVAHLNHNVNDNRDENLAALCQLHHLKHDIQHHKKSSRETINKKKKLQTLF